MAHYLCSLDQLLIFSNICVKNEIASVFLFLPMLYVLPVSIENHAKHKYNKALCVQLFKQSLNA